VRVGGFVSASTVLVSLVIAVLRSGAVHFIGASSGFVGAPEVNSPPVRKQ
jgi:hypothetical protein